MSHLLFWPTIVYFYPVGNTSAVCLTENLSPEDNADVLLLACGDPRHILYTIYANETNPLTCPRTFDITCCDVDVAILARNALLFTLLADDGVLDKLDSLWNLFYHMFVDQTTLSMLFEQCRKLVALAESAETWRAGPYGHFLTTCDAGTLAELRRIWTKYLDMATFSSEQAEQFEYSFIDGMEEMLRKRGSGSTTTAVRSAGPLALHVDQAVSRQFRNYWSSGTTDNSPRRPGRGQKQRPTVNPTFAFSIYGDEFAVHYATDPLCGFHLAEAFVSGKFTSPHECIPPHEVVRVAKDQFSRWCTSASKRLKDSNPSSPTFVIRMFAGDALMFCQALKYCEVTGSSLTPYNVAAWRLSTITLDDRCYGCNAVFPAPLSFNIIDTSNILDHVGLVNVLVVTAPVLRKTPSAMLYTEALLRKGDNPSQAIFEHVCGDLPTMALLLGIIPSTFISRFTTRCNVYENPTMGMGAKQYHERLAWKPIGFCGPRAQHGPDNVPAPSPCLFFPSEHLASFLFEVYLQMFSDEDIETGSQFSFLSFARMFQTPRRSGVLHYNRRSFALFVHFVKTRIQTDWLRAMELFEDLVKTDSQLLTGQHAYQELCCQLHLLGVYTPKWMSVPALRLLCLEFRASVGLFRDWTQSSIPQVVTLVLVVPRNAIARLEPDFMHVGTPILQCDMDDGPRHNWFAVTSATFGSLRVSGTGEHRTGVVVEGDAGMGTDVGIHAPAMQPPWRSGAPLIIMFSVPSGLVMDFGRNPRATVGLALRSTPGVAARFTDMLGYDLTVFRTNLTDPERVSVLAQTPVLGTSASTNRGRGADAVTAGHWQKNMRGSSYLQETTSSPDTLHATSTDIHVQMDDKFSAVQSFTIRIDVTNPIARATLSNKKTVPSLNSGSGSTRSLDACVRIGTHIFPLRFPLPVDVARAKLRIARRSSYVEVIAPFDHRSDSDLSNRFALLSLGTDNDSTPTLGSIHRLNLDRCPSFNLPKGSIETDWCNLHVSLMFSELEEERAFCSQTESRIAGSRTSTPAPDTLLHVKQTMHLLLRSAAGTTPDGRAPGKVFALCDTSRRGLQYLYIVVARVRLDVGSHTVVADVFVATGTPAVRAALDMAVRHGQGLRKSDGSAIKCITTDADETAAWFHLLPRLTERCRTWPHKTSCAYRDSKHQEQKADEHALRTWGRQSPLCECGAGIGTEVFPKEFERVAPYLTRAAFSPLFPVPYLKEVDVPMDDPFTVVGDWEPWNAATRRTTLHDRNDDIRARETDAAVVGYRCRSCGKEGGLACSRCKRARYCSKECQRADWKAHKKDCGSATDAVRGSNLA